MGQGHCRNLRQPAPWRVEFRSVSHDEQHRQARRPIDRAVEKLARTRIDPVQVFADEKNRLPSSQFLELPYQRIEGLFLLPLCAQCDRRIALLRR